MQFGVIEKLTSVCYFPTARETVLLPIHNAIKLVTTCYTNNLVLLFHQNNFCIFCRPNYGTANYRENSFTRSKRRRRSNNIYSNRSGSSAVVDIIDFIDNLSPKKVGKIKQYFFGFIKENGPN